MVDSRDNAYFALSTEGSWIDRIRTRLPYSFESVEAQTRPTGRERKRYVLSGPVLRKGRALG